MTSPSTAIPAIHIGRATPLGPVTYFPLWTDAPDTNGLVTGATALIDVAELPGQPEVSHLAVTNPSGAPALLIEGELLEGGWQHRVLQHDVIVGSGQSLVVDVACVEAGRWQEKGGHRRQSRRASPRIRAALHASPAPARQHEVWERVAGYETAFGASATSSYLDHVDHLTSQAPDIIDALESARAVEPLAGQRGIVFGVDGYPVGIEIFESTAALQAHLGQILSSLLLDATALASGTEPVPGRRARRLAAHLEGLSPKPEPGLDGGGGTLYAADTDKIVIRGIQMDGRWAHLSVYDRRHPLLAL